MRDWLRSERGVQPRPLVFIEDHVSHVFDLCDALAAKETVPGELLGCCSIVLLDTPGPDTEFEAVRLLTSYPALQVLAGPFAAPLRPALRALETAPHSLPPRLADADFAALLAAHAQL